MPQPQGRLCEGDWERHKALIRKRFVVEGLSLKECICELQSIGLDLTPKQLEYRLKKWGFKRNISARGWRYIDHQIEKRSRQGKMSQVLFLGKPVKASRILKETYRSRNVPTLTRVLSPQIPQKPPGLDIQIVTPPSSESGELQYPPSLPWLPFERDSWQVLFDISPSQVQNNPRENCRLSATFGCTGVPTVLDDPSVAAILASKVRATIRQSMMHQTPDPDLARNVLKKLIFIFSNELYRFPRLTTREHQLGRGLMYLMQRSGILESPLDFQSLGWTFSTFAEKLFHYSLRSAVADIGDQSTAVVKWLLSSGFNPNNLVYDHNLGCIYSLQYACSKGAIGVARLLLRAGANANLVPPYYSHACWREPIHLLLDCWKVHGPLGETRRPCNLLKGVLDLITHGANVNPDTKSASGKEEPTPLTKAVSMGEIDLMKVLVQNGASLLTKKKQRHSCLSGGFTESSSPLAAAAGYQGADKHGMTATELVEVALRMLAQQCPELNPECFIDFDVILSAAEADNVDALRFLCTQGSRIDTVHEDGYTALHAAAFRGALKTCKFLVESGISVGPFNHKVPSPLHLACAGSHVGVVQFLYERAVKAGCDAVSTASSRMAGVWISPLGAALRGRPGSAAQSCALYLVQQLESISNSDFRGAVERGYHRVVHAMLPKMGLSPQCKATSSSKPNYCSPFEECMARLIQYGLCPFTDPIRLALGLGSCSLVEQCVTSGISWRSRSTTGASNLETALITGERNLISRSYNMDPSFYDSGALCAAVACAVQTNDHSWVRLLLHNRPTGFVTDKFEGAALAIAMYHRDYDLINLARVSMPLAQVALLPKLTPGLAKGFLSRLAVPIGIWKVAQNSTNTVPFWRSDSCVEASPLAAGIASGDLDLTRHLVSLGLRADRFCLSVAACINSNDMFAAIAGSYSDGPASPERLVNYTPVYWATLKSNVSMVRKLVDMDENLDFPVDLPGHLPNSYVQMAIADSNLDLLDTLLALGVDVKDAPKSSRGLTSLQLAAALGSLPIARRLLDHGADVNAPGPDPWGTALEWAVHYSRIDIVRLLLSEGAEITGRGRVLYVKAVKLALRSGDYATANVLWAHGGWTPEDKRRMNEDLLVEPHAPRPPFERFRGFLEASDEANGTTDCEDDSELPSSWFLTGQLERQNPQNDIGEAADDVGFMMMAVTSDVSLLDSVIEVERDFFLEGLETNDREMRFSSIACGNHES